MSGRRAGGRRRQGGLALVMVLWIFMTLAVLALDFAQYMRGDAMAAVNVSEATRGYYLALAGMNRAIFELLEVRESGEEVGYLAEQFGRAPTGMEEEAEPFRVQIQPDGQWHEGDFDGGRYAVRIVDEGGRVAINAVGAPFLTALITNMLRGGNRTEGLDVRESREVQTIVDSILDWRDPNDLERVEGAESKYYQGLTPPYPAKNGFIDFPEELRYVRGVTLELLYGTETMPGLRDIVSVHGRRPRINIRSVTEPVLQAVLGLDEETLAELMLLRGEDYALFADFLQVEAALAAPGAGVIFVDEPARVVRVDAQGDVRRKRNRARVSAVVDLESDLFDGPRVLRWMDDAAWETMYDTGDGMAADPGAEGAGL